MFDKLTRSELFALIDTLPERDREELFMLMRTLDERSFYQLNPAQWMADYLDIDIKTLVWSLNPGYKEQGYVDEDGNHLPERWDGTPDPINTLLLGLARWKDVAVESGTGLGKTFVAAATMLWFLAVYPESQVITTAPRSDQLEKNLWKEVDRLWPKFAEHFPDAEMTHLRIRMAPNTPGMRDSWSAYGFVTGVAAGEESAAKAQGIHGEHILFIFEETVGVPSAIMEAIENTCTDVHNLRLFLGNPSSVTDTLHQMFIRDGILGVRVSGYDHPNIVNNDPEIPFEDHDKIVPYYSWKSILNRRNKYGPEPEYYNNHPLYKSRVRGICPSGSTFSLFTNKTLDVLESYLGAQNHQDGKDGRYIEKLTHEWSARNCPPLSKEWKVPQGDPRVEGFTRIYEEPLYTHVDRYLIFGDVAEDSGDGDFHAAVVLDRIKKKPVALIHMRGPRQYYAAELVRLAHYYAIYQWEEEHWYQPVLCWERNAPGSLHLIPEFTTYPNLYIQRSIDSPKTGKMKNAWGWYTTSKNRPDMISSLEEWGLSLRTKPWRVPDEKILREMQVFEWDEKKRKYQARSGEHDDIMMALAGALLLDKILPDPVSIPDEPPKEVREHWMARKKLFEETRGGRKKRKSGGDRHLPRL